MRRKRRASPTHNNSSQGPLHSSARTIEGTIHSFNGKNIASAPPEERQQMVKDIFRIIRQTDRIPVSIAAKESGVSVWWEYFNEADTLNQMEMDFDLAMQGNPNPVQTVEGSRSITKARKVQPHINDSKITFK